MRDGDLVFAKITPCMENGKIARLHGLRNGFAFGSTEFIVIRTGDSLDGNYLAQFLLRRSLRREAQEKMTGTAGQLRVPVGFLKAYRLPLPPMSEQRRIVAKLEELFSELDAGVAALRRAQRRLTRYRQALLHAAVTGELTREWRGQLAQAAEHAEELLSKVLADREGLKIRVGRQAQANRDAGLELPTIPAKWTWCRLPEIGELARGKSRHRPRDAKHLYGGPYPFIQTGEIRKSLGSIRQFEQTYSEAGFAQSRLWPRGTLCITIAANIAETGVLQFEACFPDSVVGFIPHSSLEVRFFEAFIRSEKERLESYAPATAQKNINLETLSSLAVPLPPIEEQQAILAELDRRLSAADALAATLHTSLRRAERLRQSILERAFRGELVPQDPNDEPAEALLARMRAAATDVSTPRRRGRPPKAATPTPHPRRRRGRPRKQVKA
ncbi:MAG: restriction endonuclease subunit S [Geothrix sp.]|nr:restriction endonuclease subunit S [Geothrix sp.]